MGSTARLVGINYKSRRNCFSLYCTVLFVAAADLRKRIAIYEAVYEQLCELSQSFVRIINAGRQVQVNLIVGEDTLFFCGRVAVVVQPFSSTRNCADRVSADAHCIFPYELATQQEPNFPLPSR